MIPWQKLPKELQRAILTIVVLSGEAAAASSCRPMVCDPPPPPRATPTPTMTMTPASPLTPMICDPAPPPTITRTPTMTPMICDPAPPPSGKASMTPMLCDPPPQPDLTPRPTSTAEAALPGFEARSVQVTPNQVDAGIEVRGKVTDRQGNPVKQARITLAAPGIEVLSRTNNDGTYTLRFKTPGSFMMFVGTDTSYGVPLDLKLHDLATVDWIAVSAQSRAPLPLAEIRTVKIARIAAGSADAQGLAFAATSPWPSADYRWTVSGGTLTTGGMLTTAGSRVRWQPPAAPGRYLLQVVADWDYAGLAVDALVLTVATDGRVTVS